MAVRPDTPELARVIAIADANSNTLGLFPRSGFEREAANERVLAAIGPGQEVWGFVLYRTTATRAVVHMLCVDEPWRKQGVARLMCDELKARTRHLPGIVCHCALEFEALDAWKRLGFVPLGEKEGRGKSRRALIRLYFDHGHPHLFSESVQARAEATIVAVMDLNVAIRLQDQDPNDTEIAAIQADWLLEEVSLWVTDEALVEVTRQPDSKERQRRTAFLRSQNAVSRDLRIEMEAFALLEETIGKPQREQDESDLRQLAQSIAGGAEVFLTGDAKLLRHAKTIVDQFGVEVFTPLDLLLSLDQVVRDSDYAPVRLHGSSLSCERPAQPELEGLIDRFLNNGAGEKRHEFAKLVGRAIASGAAHRVDLVRESNQDTAALLVTEAEGTDNIRVKVLRVRRGRRAETLTRHLLQTAVRRAVEAGRRLVIIDEQRPLHPYEIAALRSGFVECEGGRWMKVSVKGVHDRNTLASTVKSLADTADAPSLAGLEAALREPDITEESDLEIERAIWPGMLLSSPLRSFVVPIRPRFAEHLFDHRLGAESLFGGDPSLLLNCENVYYRSSHSRIVCAPGRVLWYVSAEEGSAVRELRACSLVLATHVGPACDLYKRFQRLGIYAWPDVLAIADGDPDGSVMAIHFGLTEMLPKPVPGTELRPMIARYRCSTPPPLSMPVEIPDSCFEEICERAYDSST